MRFFWRAGLHIAISVAGLLVLFQNCQGPTSETASYTDVNGAQFTLEPLGHRCSLPWDQTQFLDEGDTAPAFASPTAPEGESCRPETRHCADGVLNGSFAFATCTVLPKRDIDCVSPFTGGAIVADGDSVDTFVIDASGGCSAQSRVCAKGTLAGTGNLAACPQVDACKTPWGFVIPEGQNIQVLDESGTPAPEKACGRNIYSYGCSNQTLSKVVVNTACE